MAQHKTVITPLLTHWCYQSRTQSHQCYSDSIALQWHSPGIILGMGSANERWCYIITLSPIEWAHTQNETRLTLQLQFSFLQLQTYCRPAMEKHQGNTAGSPWQQYNLRDHSGYGLSQWETMLQCNVVPHWPSPYQEWSLNLYIFIPKLVNVIFCAISC